MTKFEQDYRELIEKSLEFGEFVKKNQGDYNNEDSATLKSLNESWTFVSLDENLISLRNKFGDIYEYDVKTHQFTRIISEQERSEVEKKWPKAEA